MCLHLFGSEIELVQVSNVAIRYDVFYSLGLRLRVVLHNLSENVSELRLVLVEKVVVYFVVNSVLLELSLYKI